MKPKKDFVNTLRFWEDMQEYYNSLSEEEKLKFRDVIEPEPLEIAEGNDENGFPIPYELLQKVEVEVSL